MSTIEKYYQILEIPTSSDVNTIKKAYRKKAKLLHPDRNNQSNAHAQFIELSEAYEGLINFKTYGYSNKPINNTSYEDEIRNQREAARERARRNAQMRYEEYKKTDHYKQSIAWNDIVSQLFIVFAIILLGAPLYFYLFYGSEGLWGGFLICLATLSFSLPALFMQKSKFSLSKIQESLSIVLHTIEFHLALAIPINVYLFFSYTLNTQIILSFIVKITILSIASYHLIHRLPQVKITKRMRKYIFVIVIPSVINLFFFLNYIFSRQPVVEKYSFKYNNTTEIILKTRKYDAFPMFTFFFDHKAIEYHKEIKYTFEKGLFGIKVLKDYEFIK